jgi:hypothetical protein
MNAAEELLTLITDAAEETGVSLQKAASDVAAYAAARAQHLAENVPADDPGYMLAVRAERNAVALYAGVAADDEEEAAVAKAKATWIGVVGGGIAIIAKALATGAAVIA